MQTLINDLLAYSRVSTRGKGFETTDGNAVLKAALANLSASVNESKAVVTHDDLPTVLADGVQLAQVFQNLLSTTANLGGFGQQPHDERAVIAGHGRVGLRFGGPGCVRRSRQKSLRAS